MPLITFEEIHENDKKYKKEKIEQIKSFLRSDETIQELCAKNGFNLDWIEFVPVMFGKLPVSAKTDHGIIILNENLLIKSDFAEICSYMVHEFTHYLQQCCGNKGTQSSNTGNYLENPYEQEAFQQQVSFLAENKSPEHAEEYVQELLDHHKVEDNKRKKTEDVLMSDVKL